MDREEIVAEPETTRLDDEAVPVMAMLVPVALRKVKFWRVEEPETAMLEKVAEPPV